MVIIAIHLNGEAEFVIIYLIPVLSKERMAEFVKWWIYIDVPGKTVYGVHGIFEVQYDHMCICYDFKTYGLELIDK